MNHPVTQAYAQDHPKRNVAVVGLRDDIGNILLVRTRKLSEWWQPIGGGVDEQDKSPESAALRELQEEIGVALDVSDLRLVATVPYDFGEGAVHFFEALVDRPSLKMTIDEQEIIDIKWFSIEDALKLPAFNATRSFLQKLSM